MGTVFIIFAILFVLAPIARAYAGRISREDVPIEVGGAVELARLREEVDRLSAQVGRLEEEQSFMVRLLSESERRKLSDGRPPDG